jgi:hypothetical protein
VCRVGRIVGLGHIWRPMPARCRGGSTQWSSASGRRAVSKFYRDPLGDERGRTQAMAQTRSGSEGRFQISSDESIGPDVTLYLIAKGGEVADKGCGTATNSSPH